MTEVQTPVADLLKAYAELDIELDKVKEQEKLLKGQKDQLNRELVERFNAEGIDGMKLPGIGNFYLTAQTYARVTAEKRGEFIAWLDGKGLGDLAPRTLNAQTLAKQYRDWEENDLPLPPAELVEVHRETKLTLRTA